MRIAVISDLHGNLPALQAVLADIDRRGADLIWCLGDLAFKGPAPDECIQHLRTRKIPCVLGNTDAELLQAAGSTASVALPPPDGSVPYYQWHIRHLGAGQLAFLAALPEHIEAEVDGVHFLLSHAAPDSLVRGLFHPDKSDGFAARLKQAPARFVLVGHTHRAALVCEGGKTMINPGAVGFSLDGDWRAGYALIEPSSGAVSLIRVEYDLSRAEAIARERGFCFSPSWYADALRRGWWEPVPWLERAEKIDHM